MILWTIRASTLLYIIALALLIRRKNARPYWIAAWAFYLAHVVAAFQITYHWSHSAAVAETARQTQALFGLNWGGGIWFNYVFTAIWTLDVLFLSRHRQPAWINTAIHSYIAFMFLNGAIVFGHGPVRWIAAAAALALLFLPRPTSRPSPPSYTGTR